jgi:phosphoribosylamine--glycine ligase
MKHLVIGSGGREHALGWKLSGEGNNEVHFLPGNGGTCEIGANNAIEPTDIDAVTALAQQLEPDLVTVGPEDPLAMGLVDRLTEAGLTAFGPTASCARIESSKAFAKELMAKYSIPTAPFKIFSSRSQALAYVEKSSKQLVIKADGLARGKGAIVTRNRQEASKAVDMIMGDKAFGSAGDTVVIEKRLKGEEASVIAVTDGKDYVLFPPAQDHKPVFDRDRGPNTGGMGAYCPAPLVDDSTLERVESVVFKRLLKGLRQEGYDYVGVLYAGLMLGEKGISVIEFNARFGDPETQCTLPAVDIDLGRLLADAARGSLRATRRIRPARWAVSVVMASGGYPGTYEKGKAITGVERASAQDGVFVFHAGTRRTQDGGLVSSGGRVLAVTGTGSSLREARRKAYESSRLIRFEGGHMRSDIGAKGLARLEKLGVN